MGFLGGAVRRGGNCNGRQYERESTTETDDVAGYIEWDEYADVDRERRTEEERTGESIAGCFEGDFHGERLMNACKLFRV